jgi:serine/threonine-protein kinase RsbW
MVGTSDPVAIELVKTFSARFPSAYESVAQARRAVGGFAKTCGFSAQEISDIVLAVGEACNNAVEHGHVERGEFVISCTFEAALLRTEICDNGQGFEEFLPAPGADPSDCVGRGRGIPIMRALMDGVAYRRVSSGMTVVLEKVLLTRGVEEALGETRGLDAGGCSQPG